MNNHIVKRWIYQDQLTPAAEVDSVGNVVTRFAPGYITKGACPPLSGVVSTYAIITDHLGSVKMVVNIATGSVRQRLDYDEYGNVIMNTNPDFQPPARHHLGGFGYAGGLYDEQTKLVRFGARDYSAKEGRWTVIDPILFKGGTSNLYEYCVNDPINKADLNGLQWIYSQSTGKLYYRDRNTGQTNYYGTGYSGNGIGLNNPEKQNVKDTGPVPRGSWNIGPQYKNPRTGPGTMNLTPKKGTDTFGRDLFRIHGDNSKRNRSASKGCPILSRDLRDLINNSGDNELEVIE